MRIYGGTSVEGYYMNITGHIKSEVGAAADEYILNVDTDEYVEYLFDRFSLQPILKDEKRKVSLERLKRWRDISEDFYTQAGRVEVEQFKIGYPILVNDKTVEVFGLDWGLAFSAHDWTLDQSGGHIFAMVDKTTTSVQDEIKLIDRVISNKNILIEDKNPQLKETIKRIVEDRKKKVSEDFEDFEKLVKEIDIPLEVIKKDAIKEISFGVKPEIKSLVPPKANPKEKYVLDRQKVLTIAEIVDNVAKNFEAAPKSYNNFEEERLRDIILSSLNSVFSGRATAETFRNRGKTDIYLNIEKGCILVIECKWWNGKGTLDEAVDQLFRYLTWRENYGVIILFSKNKGFSNVLDTVASTLKNNQSYSSGFQVTSQSNFM